MSHPLCKEHPYYCNESNYYSNEPREVHETMTDFLDEYEDADVDMNLCFRWDLHEAGEDHDTQFAEVFMMHQRKGIFAPHHIKKWEEHELDRFRAYAEKHWQTLCAMWSPIANAPKEML